MTSRTRLTPFQELCLASIQRLHRHGTARLEHVTRRITPKGKKPSAYGRCVLRALKPLASAGVLLRGAPDADGWIFSLTSRGSDYVRKLELRTSNDR